MGVKFCEKGGVDTKIGEDIEEVDADRSANRVSASHAGGILVTIDLRNGDHILFLGSYRKGKAYAARRDSDSASSIDMPRATMPPRISVFTVLFSPKRSLVRSLAKLECTSRIVSANSYQSTEGPKSVFHTHKCTQVPALHS